jgi:hypothetical protein
VHGLEVKYSGQINFVYLDIDDPRNDGFKKALGYHYQPNLFLLDGQGSILHTWLGPITEEQLTQEFQKALAGLVE